MHTLHIALIGDYDPTVTAHIAIPKALELSAQALNCKLEYHWLGTETITDTEMLNTFDALWCVPASPYKSMQGALTAIRFAREKPIPFLGTCGGYQHAILEFAQTVLGYQEADHAETNPEATMPLVAPLSCALVETADSITLKPSSKLAEIYGQSEVTEMYRCRYGLNPEYVSLFENSALVISAVDKNNEARAFELSNHPFFIGVGFQPERSGLKGEVHPLITAFVKAASLLVNEITHLKTL
jgi:CTP synthase (UTP-ammonia lyase)